MSERDQNRFDHPSQSNSKLVFSLSQPGHSATTFLSSSPDATVLTFDIASHRYASVARSTVAQLFPGRITVIDGDSTQTLPKYSAAHPNETCDLIVVDGGHTYPVAMADLENFRPLANKARNLVLMDDVACSSDFCKDPQKAWDSAKTNGWVRELGCYPAPGGHRGFCVGRYE